MFGYHLCKAKFSLIFSFEFCKISETLKTIAIEEIVHLHYIFICSFGKWKVAYLSVSLLMHISQVILHFKVVSWGHTWTRSDHQAKIDLSFHVPPSKSKKREIKQKEI